MGVQNVARLDKALFLECVKRILYQDTCTEDTCTKILYKI